MEQASTAARDTPPVCTDVAVVVRGHRLPGRSCGQWHDVHVGLQIGEHAEGLVPADCGSAEWRTSVRVIRREDGVEFRGPAVYGRRGDQFLYLAWGELCEGRFAMFRRAKLMLADAISGAEAGSTVVIEVDLTDDHGLPRCARVRGRALRAS